jgi:hypothetical protein
MVLMTFGRYPSGTGLVFAGVLGMIYVLSEEEVAEVGRGGWALLKDIELDDAVELVGAWGTVGREFACWAGPPKMELDDDDMVAVLPGVEAWYN